MGNVAPFEVLSDLAAPGKEARIFRARVASVYKDASGTQLSLLFRVTPLSFGLLTGDTDNAIENVVLVVPGFGSLEGQGDPPSGMVCIPEVGSIVLVVWDGTRWCIVGAYTGPVRGRMESQLDPEQRAITYNAGVEVAQLRRVGVPGFDLPHWSQGLEPGDAFLGKGQARIKVCGVGAVIGADLHCCQFYTRDGRIIERFADRQTRGIGYWRSQRYQFAVPQEAVNSYLQSPDIIPTPELVCMDHTVQDISGRLEHQRPYLLCSRGFIHRDTLDDGRSALVTSVQPLSIREALESSDYVVSRDALIQPLVGTYDGAPGNELNDRAYLLADFQQDADGSFRLRRGNSAGQPGLSDVQDLAIDFDAKRGKLTIRIGSTGNVATQIVATGTDVASAKVEVETTAAKVTCRDAIEVVAKKATVKATTITLDGNVKITGSLTVDQNIEAVGNVKGMRVSLPQHTHPYTDDGSPSTTSIPTPTG
jgi:hypothetical protein